MTELQNSVTINRPQEVVFDYCVDLSNELEWNPDVQSMEKLTDGPVRLGTKYRAKWTRSRHIICECTRFDRPNSWTYVNGGPVEVTLKITLTPDGSGTRLVSSFDARPKGLFRLVFPIFIRVMRRTERANMTHIKAHLERQGNPPDIRG